LKIFWYDTYIMADKSPKLSTEPYKGTRDFFPEDMQVQKYIFGVMRGVAESYGYVEYDASILEDIAIYRAKTGDEIVNEQTYTFTDRGGREVTIRPEMTPTVARMVARRRHELPFPLRWYSIPNLFRYERPQRGRLREHWQLNVDVFGIDSIQADAEIIAISHSIMKAFGAKDENFQIKVNNRKLTNFVLREHLKLDEERAQKISKLIDRKAKMKPEEFSAEATSLLGKQTEQLMEFLNAPSIKDLSTMFPNNPAIEELSELLKIFADKKITNAVFDPTLMRGFDYYTGIIFEVFDTGKENSRSLFGGGHYDDLVSMFDVDKVGGVGFGMGDVTIRDYLETYNLLPEYQPTTQLYICRTDKNFDTFASELADELRQQGIRVAVDYTDRKLAAQLKTADKQNIPFVICIGEDEANTNEFKLKDLKAHSETTVNRKNLVTAL
jgi:histidyl-tRNA synthetase